PSPAEGSGRWQSLLAARPSGSPETPLCRSSRRRPTSPELHPRHDADGLWKRRHRSIVKIGRSHRDVPQAGNTENIKVVGTLGDVVAAGVDGLAARCLPIGPNDAKFSVHSAANEDTIVARYAAGIDEGIEAAASFGRQCIDVASEVAIKRRWCHQGPLVGP